MRLLIVKTLRIREKVQNGGGELHVRGKRGGRERRGDGKEKGGEEVEEGEGLRKNGREEREGMMNKKNGERKERGF